MFEFRLVYFILGGVLRVIYVKPNVSVDPDDYKNASN